MKKVISLLMIISIMILSFGTAFAAWSNETVSTGINILAEENADGLITLTVKATDSKTVGSYELNLTLSGVKLVKKSDKSTEVTDVSDAVEFGSKATAAAWVVNSASTYTSGSSLKLIVGAANLAGISNLADETIMTMYFTKSGSTITSDSFALSTARKTKSVITYTDGSAVATNKTAEVQYFGLKVTPYVAPTTDKWEAATGTDMPSAWTAPDALEGEVRRVTVFGKNATAKALAANSYGVTFGDNTYYGIVTTDAVQYWAIVIVDTEGNKITSGNTYNGTAFVGEETWSVSVSAE